MTTSPIMKDRLKEIVDNPVLWAKTFIRIFDPVSKKVIPWTARWYQAEMLLDDSLKKVARCGRRTGKTETMCVKGLHKAFTNKNFRILYVTPYENQVRLIFMRLREMIDGSPLLKKEVIKVTSNPYVILLKNGSGMMGFTTGASSGSGGASIRGQKADYIFMDEVDYMTEADFDTVTTIAAERDDIGIFLSSTPTGRRSKFYEACKNKKMGYTEHFHPSTHNPNWSDTMEAEYRAQLTPSGFVHEIMAEFGEQDTGVFNKDKVDLALTHDYYAYNELSYIQNQRAKSSSIELAMINYAKGVRAPINPFRTMGVDWDKYGSSSSILIMDYDIVYNKFRVVKRIEVPKAEYSYDAAVNLIIELNEQYNPSFIYCDRGAGEYQIERLHIHGEENPHTGLKYKVKGWQFKNTLDIMDPITKTFTKQPMKPFMVSQLQILFERERVILSPFDDLLHKQLIDYEVERISQQGMPVFTSKEEHFVDALGLAYLAFVLEFPELTDTIKKPTFTSVIRETPNRLGESRVNMELREARSNSFQKLSNNHDGDLKGDKPYWEKTTTGGSIRSPGGNWGSRSTRSARNAPTRRMW